MNQEKSEPVICFGQQPSGFFPKRYVYAKIKTARELQKKIGGKIVFFYHDSDADYRETITVMTDLKTKEEARINFLVENKIQKKYSPLCYKKITKGWQEETIRRLPRFMEKSLVDIFASVRADTVADFCLEMYKKLGLLDGVEVVRSGDKDFRNISSELPEYFADVVYEGEIVRAEMYREGGLEKLRLHEGGGKYLDIPVPAKIEKWQKNPNREHRFANMQSVIHCTHYIAGASEAEYLNKADFPEVVFVNREEIDESDHAYIPLGK
ncbi:MAG: hypothetical protein KA515_01600 [Candidatus Pacebacteria bacterium]|nr:hypothetical protein [Candidatus Paceibacterota bacterium]